MDEILQNKLVLTAAENLALSIDGTFYEKELFEKGTAKIRYFDSKEEIEKYCDCSLILYTKAINADKFFERKKIDIKRKRWILMSGDAILSGYKNYYDFLPADKIKNEVINTFVSEGRALASAKRLKEFKDRKIRAVEVEEVYRIGVENK